ncbi:MAG: hypothetical protein ABIO70_17245 [Pseudomonadota bacterium]
MVGSTLLWAAISCSCTPNTVDTDQGDTSGAETALGDTSAADTAEGDTGDPVDADVVLYVALGGVDDGNDCLDPENPCASPEHAVAQLAAVEPTLSVRISIGPGDFLVYTLDLTGRSSLTLAGAGVEETWLMGPFPDDELAPAPVIAVSGEDVTVSGLTITGIASDEANGAGVMVMGPSSGIYLHDLRIDGTWPGAESGGALGVNLLAPGAEMGIEARLLRLQVIGFNFKAGVLLKGGYQVTAFDGCVFYGNDHAVGMTNEIGETVDPEVVIENSIFVENRVGAGVHMPLEDPTSVRIDWNLFGPTDQPVERLELGVGNLEATDPLFRSAPEDLSLQSTVEGDAGCSPAIDAGDPASPWSAEPSPNGERVNLGHQGNTRAASRSCAAR